MFEYSKSSWQGRRWGARGAAGRASRSARWLQPLRRWHSLLGSVSLAGFSDFSPPFHLSILHESFYFRGEAGPSLGLLRNSCLKEKGKKKNTTPHPVPGPFRQGKQHRQLPCPFRVTLRPAIASSRTSLPTAALPNRLWKNPSEIAVGLISSMKTRSILREGARESGREREREGRDCHHPRSDVSF